MAKGPDPDSLSEASFRPLLYSYHNQYLLSTYYAAPLGSGMAGKTALLVSCVLLA